MKSFNIAVLVAVGISQAVSASNWPSWRGPDGNNSTPEKNFPIQWNATNSVKWRAELPEPANSSPIVWKDRVFITQPLDDGRQRTLMCFDRASGKLLWQKGVSYEEADTRHETNPHCAASPVTDGELVVASFASAGIVAYDFGGRELWRTDLGKQKHTWGQGSSPVIHGERIFIYHGPGPNSALYALEKRSGKQLWKVTLPEVHPTERFDGFAGKSDGMLGSFSTPLVIRVGNRDEIVLTVADKVRAFAPTDGRELWTCDGMNPLVYTSPTFTGTDIVAMGGFFGSVCIVKAGGDGDVTKTHRRFYEQRANKHRIGSPISRDGYIFLSNTIGVAECIDLATGKPVWEERLKAVGSKGETWSSMVASGDRLYVVNQSGDTFVLRAGPKFEVLAVNPIGEMSN